MIPLAVIVTAMSTRSRSAVPRAQAIPLPRSRRGCKPRVPEPESGPVLAPMRTFFSQTVMERRKLGTLSAILITEP